MASRISHTSFDAVDAYAQSVFWSRVLDFIEDPEDPNLPGHVECLMGASQLADHRRPGGGGWITLADPEGNEFCILAMEPAGSGATT